MLTPARRHAIAFAARKAAEKAGTPLPGHAPTIESHNPAWSEYRLQLMQLGEDLRRLSRIQSIEAKIVAKRLMIRQYDTWVDSALAGVSAAQDEIVTTTLIWSIDIADWPRALTLAKHVLRNGLTLPERYRRDAATLIAEQVATAGLTTPATVDLTTLQVVDDLTAKADMPDEVRAKLKKAIGLSLRAQVDAFDPASDSARAGGKPAMIALALTYLQRALALDPKSGVKKLIESLQREAKKEEVPA